MVDEGSIPFRSSDIVLYMAEWHTHRIGMKKNISERAASQADGSKDRWKVWGSDIFLFNNTNSNPLTGLSPVIENDNQINKNKQ